MVLALLIHWMASTLAIASEIGLAVLIPYLRKGPRLESIGKDGVRHTLVPYNSVISWVSPRNCWVYAAPNTSLCIFLHGPLGLANDDIPMLGQGV